MFPYVSRKLGLSISMRNKSDLQYLCRRLQAGIKDFVYNNFSIFISDERKEEGILASLYRQSEKIYRQSSALAEGYRKYAVSLGLKPDKKYAFFDLCSQGTAQRGVQSILPFLHGLYLHRNGAMENEYAVEAESFVPQVADQVSKVFLFEYIFTSDEPSVRSIKSDGTIIFEEEKRTEKEIKEQADARLKVKEYFREYLHLCRIEESTSRTVGQQLLDLISNNVFKKELKTLEKMMLHDDLKEEATYVKII